MDNQKDLALVPKSDADPPKEGRLAAAVRESLLEVLSGPLTIASLYRISRICSGATTLLEPEHPRKRMGVVSNVFDPESVGAVGYDVAIPQQSFNGAENFGTQVIREAMALLAEWHKKKVAPEPAPEPDAFSLTVAIQNAEKLGMPEVVEKLKDQLRAKYGVTQPASPPPAESFRCLRCGQVCEEGSDYCSEHQS